MVDMMTFKTEVMSIVGHVARVLSAEIFTAAEKWLNKPNPETEDRLRVAVDSLCDEAVQKILQVFEEETGGGAEVEEEEHHSGSTHKKSETLTTTKTHEGEGGGGEALLPTEHRTEHRTEHSYILVYGSSTVDSRCLLLSVQSSSDGKNETTEEIFEVTSLLSSSCSSSPPPHVDFPDHDYALPYSSPSGTTAAEQGQVSAVRRRKPRCSGRKQDTNATQSPETHQQCSECGMLFPTSERLVSHQRKSHPVCSMCGSLFTGLLKLREHEMKEHGLLPYTCDYCPKRFNHKAHRNLHVKARHTGEKTCHCDICGKGYSGPSVMKTHRMTHFNKMFICDICGKSFYHACHLTRHKLVHQEVRPYKCSTCGKGFTQATNLRSHQVIHTGERQLCSICGKSFRCLKNHIISKHSHELPSCELPVRDAIITCEVCGKKFPNQSQFKVHQRSHTGEKPFHCDICGKSYRLKEMLRDHRYTHTGEKPYRCSLCSKTFNQATSFMRHRSIHSGETPHSCHDCGKHFRLRTFLKAHLQTKAHQRRSQQRQPTSDL